MKIREVKNVDQRGKNVDQSGKIKVKEVKNEVQRGKNVAYREVKNAGQRDKK